MNKALGHYEIVDKLGEGGMGVVYKARDTHLNRFVAIKILPPDKVANTSRRQRFVQEAQAASSLSHPNIITVHDIAHENSTDFMVMEYVHGKTLDQLIPRKGMRLSEALKISVQIAHALAAAHAVGIVHRDLKPGNVMVTESGLVKVLDFGLAKLTETSGNSEEDSTRTLRHSTEEGTILGTAAYMSPEQAEGKKVDPRSDVFSFGTLLYEMVTGQRAFHGDTKMSTLAAILNSDPKPVSDIIPGIPPEIEKLVRKCLRKDPGRRYQHMDDLKLALEELKEESDSGTLPGIDKDDLPSRSSRRLFVLACMVLVVAAGLAGWLVLRNRTSPSREQAREAPQAALTAVPLTTYAGSEYAPTFSPDGNQVAFSWDGPKQDNDDIYVKLIGPGEPLRITTDPAADSSPAWSPDGKWIAFERLRGQDAELLVVPALGGPERKLGDTGAGLIYFNPAWSPDSKWLVTSVQSAPRAPGALFLIPLSGGEKRRLTSPPPSSHGDGSPAFSPDGRAIVFSRGGSGGSRDFYLLRLTAELRPSGEPQRLTFEERGAPGSAWAADGKSIIYTYGIASYALWRLTLPGSGDIGSPQSLSFAGDGFMPCVSRQGNRLAFTRDVTDDNVWRAQLTEPGGTAKDPSSFIASTRNDYAPQYSPDGKRIVFRSTRTGFREIWTSNSDGSNPVQLTDFRTAAGGPHWSPDGRQIVLFANPGGPADIYSVSGDGGLPRRLTNDPAEDVFPIFSVDGQLVYFASNRTGRYEVFKMPAQGGEPAQVTKNGGAASQESPDGKFLYYMRERTRTSSLWRMPVTGGEEEKLLDSVSWFINFAVTPKGIYYIPARRDGQFFVEYLDLATRKVKPVFTIGSRPISQGLSVSPDERWILWTQTDVAGSDLMLVENFR